MGVETTTCFACGAEVVEAPGPVHAYMLAAPGCWALFCSLQDWKHSLVGDDGVNTSQHVVDAYAVQHASNPSRRNRQSVAVHLMSLCASQEKEVPGVRLRTLLGAWTHRDYPQLLPRPSSFPITVRQVSDADAAVRPDLVSAWAKSTWLAWSAHHDEVRGWLAEMPIL